MKKIVVKASLSVIFFPLFIGTLSAETSSSTVTTLPNEYAICKKRALDKRTETMRPALKAYIASSTEINKKTQREFDVIRWNFNGSYRENSKKILEQAKNETASVNEKINQVRVIAQSTWKAEDALCDFIQSRASSTQKTTKKLSRAKHS